MVTVSRDMLVDIVGQVSQPALKQWLKISELPRTATNTDEFYELLKRNIERGILSLEALREAVLEIEENGGKRIYLRKIEVPARLKNRADFVSHLHDLHLSLSENITASIQMPPNPIINYIVWTPQGLRIKATETNIDLELDYESRSFIEKKVTKYLIALVDFNSGFVQIRLDPPGMLHSHKNSDDKSDPRVYENFYFEWFKNIIGVDELNRYDINGVAEKIVNTQPRIFRLPTELVRTGANSKQRYSCRLDVRDDPARQAAAQADSQNWVYEYLRGYWIPEQSNGLLQRELYMELRRDISMVHFLADCLSDEVDYALSRIRTL